MPQPSPIMKSEDPLIDEIRQIRADLDAQYPDWADYAKHIREAADKLRHAAATQKSGSSQDIRP